MSGGTFRETAGLLRPSIWETFCSMKLSKGNLIKIFGRLAGGLPGGSMLLGLNGGPPAGCVLSYWGCPDPELPLPAAGAALVCSLRPDPRSGKMYVA